jgi:uncharacterized protein (DUF433 family)
MATEAPAKPRAPIERTEHPHVVKSADTLGGEPRVEDSRLAVRHVLRLFESGTAPAAIAEKYGLSVAQVHDALSYAYDHPDEIAFHAERHKIRNVMREQDLVMVNSRLISRTALKPSDVPNGATVYTWETLPPELEH